MWIFFFLSICYEVGKDLRVWQTIYCLHTVLRSSFPKTAITASSNGLPRLYLADWASNKPSYLFLEKLLWKSIQKITSSLHIWHHSVHDKDLESPIQTLKNIHKNSCQRRKKYQIEVTNEFEKILGEGDKFEPF